MQNCEEIFHSDTSALADSVIRWCTNENCAMNYNENNDPRDKMNCLRNSVPNVGAIVKVPSRSMANQFSAVGWFANYTAFVETSAHFQISQLDSHGNSAKYEKILEIKSSCHVFAKINGRLTVAMHSCSMIHRTSQPTGTFSAACSFAPTFRLSHRRTSCLDTVLNICKRCPIVAPTYFPTDALESTRHRRIGGETFASNDVAHTRVSADIADRSPRICCPAGVRMCHLRIRTTTFRHQK